MGEHPKQPFGIIQLVWGIVSGDREDLLPKPNAIEHRKMWGGGGREHAPHLTARAKGEVAEQARRQLPNYSAREWS